jgi:hypothetical protein
VTKKKIADMSLDEKVEAAFLRAMRKVIKQAKDTGTPIILWEDDRVKGIPCEELDAYAAERLPEDWFE